MILSLTLLNGLRNTSRNHCRLNTIHRAICRCQLQLYHAERRSYVNMVQKATCAVGQGSFITALFQSGKVFNGQTSPNLTFLLEIMDAVSSGLKRRETFQRVISVQFKSQHHWWCGGGISAYGVGSLHVLEGTMNAERYIKGLEQHMLPSRQRLFQQDNTKPHIAAITTAWLRSKRVRVLNWPACSPDLSPTDNIWCIITQKIHQRWPQTLQQLETYIRQEWDQIPHQTTKLQKLITSMPRCLQTVLKRRGDATPRWTCPRPNYCETCSRHHIWNELILCIKLQQQKKHRPLHRPEVCFIKQV